MISKNLILLNQVGSYRSRQNILINLLIPRIYSDSNILDYTLISIDLRSIQIGDVIVYLKYEVMYILGIGKYLLKLYKVRSFRDRTLYVVDIDDFSTEIMHYDTGETGLILRRS